MKIFDEIGVFDNEKRFLIDYANIKQKLLPNQNDFLDEKELLNYFANLSKGFPLVLPLGLKCFDYKNIKKIFKIEKKDVFKNIYGLNNFKYKPAKRFLSFGNWFCVGAKPKKKYSHLIKFMINYNQRLKKYVRKLKGQNKIIASFQTRNIPHLGHEEIIKQLLNKCDHVVINPVIGPKKEGDINYNQLYKIYKYLINKRYKGKVSYFPVIANMFYAGPREAMHHSIIRQSLGFDMFNIGRDHAGAESAYNPNLSIRTALRFKKKFKINLSISNGAYFCKICKKVVIKGSCKHHIKSFNLKNISGTDFRKKMSRKIFFKFASKDIQIFIHKLGKNIFV